MAVFRVLLEEWITGTGAWTPAHQAGSVWLVESHPHLFYGSVLSSQIAAVCLPNLLSQVHSTFAGIEQAQRTVCLANKWMQALFAHEGLLQALGVRERQNERWGFLASEAP